MSVYVLYTDFLRLAKTVRHKLHNRRKNMNDSLHGKTIFITGASSGIGKACAEKFAACGAKLILLARRQNRLEQIMQTLKVPTHLICADIREHNELEHEISNIPVDFTSIDVLINNAGVTLGDGPIHKRDINDWENMVKTNVNGMISCTRLVLPMMIKRNQGHIINLGSTAGTYPRPGNPIYCASKAFSKQFSLSLRADLKDSAIRITSIEPGTVRDTELALGRVNGDVEKLNQLFDGFNYLLPEDIAESIYWAVSLPSHVNINRIDLMATCQTFSNLTSTKE